MIKRTLAIAGFLLLFSQPLIGIPLGLVFGVHMADQCAPAADFTVCITQEIETWTSQLF
jgi:hypothetical protein